MTAPPVAQLVEAGLRKDGTILAGSSADWLKRRHVEWAANHDRWTFARDNYTGELLDPANVHKYLQQRRQGEGNEGFRERARCADYSNHLAVVIDSMAGMLTAVEGDTNRTWGKGEEQADGTTKIMGLGDPLDPESDAYRLTHNADGDNTNNSGFWNQVGIELSLTHTGWLFVDPRDGQAVYRYIIPEQVPNWFKDEDGRLIEVLLEERADARTSLQDKPQAVRQFLYFFIAGWERWRLSKDGKSAKLIDQGAWAFEDEEGNAALPITQIALPMKRNSGWLMAKKNTAIFNRESERDWPLRVANSPRFLVAGDVTAFGKVIEALKKGQAALHGTDHKYTAPPVEGAKLSTEVLADKRTDFYITAFREYGDSAKTRTATEVRQDVAAGAQSYLTHLASALDEGETWAMRTATQSQFPKKADLWFVPRAVRSTNYLPSDQEKIIDRAAKRAFGEKPVPLGHTGKVETAKMIAEWMGVEFNPDEVDAAVAVQDLIEATAAGGVPIPAEARALMVVKLLTATGLVSPDEERDLEDGGKENLLEALEQAALKLAEADDTARRREAEFIPTQPLPPGQPPNGGPPKEPTDEDA